jgi:hypothetical protein
MNAQQLLSSISALNPVQQFKLLFEAMYILCTRQNWGDPFSYARSREIYMAGVLGHQVGSTYSGEDAISPDPEEDMKYFGSYSDKTFKPTHKIILGTYDTREDAYADEIRLHEFYDVANNPHFANRAKQTSTKFYVPKGLLKEIRRQKTMEILENGRQIRFLLENGYLPN